MPCLYIKWFVPIECQVPYSLLKNLIVKYNGYNKHIVKKNHYITTFDIYNLLPHLNYCAGYFHMIMVTGLAALPKI